MSALVTTAPPSLREGDTIAVVAPAGPVPLERLEPALRLLEKTFKIVVAEDIGRREGFLAGDDERRAAEFNAALRNPEVRGIWAARGGYGCSRIVSQLDEDAMCSDPIPIIGFSDVTVLLSWAASLGFQSIHAPVLTQFSELSREDQRWALDLLMGRPGEALLAEGLTPVGCAGDAIEGPLVGGNLSLLAHLCGTALAPNYDQALCILEDVGERPYAIDRYVGQLLAQEGPGGIACAKAVLLGDFTRCHDADDLSRDAIQRVDDRLRAAGLRCVSGLPIGHGARNRAFPFGGLGSLANGEIRLLV